MKLAEPNVCDLHAAPDAVRGEHPLQVGERRQRHVVECDEEVASTDPRALRGCVRDDVDDLYGLRSSVASCRPIGVAAPPMPR